MDTNDDIQDKLRRARLALEGDEHREKREKNESELNHLRQEAAMAMEGAERRAERELKIKAAEEQANAEAKRLQEISRLRQMEADRLRAEEEKKRLEKAKTDTIKEAHIEKIHQAESRIESIKQNAKVNTTSFRTLQSDLSKAVTKRKLSTGTVVMEDQKKYATPAEEPAPHSLKNQILISLLIIVMLLAGGGLAWYALNIGSFTKTTVNLNIPKIITAEHTEIVNIASSTQPEIARQEINNILKANNGSGVVSLYFTTQIRDPQNKDKIATAWLNPTKFSQLTGISITDGVSRAVTDPFTFGVLKTKTGDNNHFIIFSIKNYTRALAEMFIWEETIATDLGVLWPELNQAPTDQPASTTTPAFVDRQVNSRDVRVLANPNTNKTVLAYTFFNNKYVIITENDTAIDDIISRLAP